MLYLEEFLWICDLHFKHTVFQVGLQDVCVLLFAVPNKLLFYHTPGVGWSATSKSTLGQDCKMEHVGFLWIKVVFLVKKNWLFV